MATKITIDMTRIDLDRLQLLLGSAKVAWEEDIRELERELDALDKVLALKAVHKNKKKRT